MAFIHLENITKVYGKKEGKVEALRGISMEIRQGEMVAIMGKSGSGKSTLLNIVAGLTMPTSGRYCFQGKEIMNMKQRELNQFRRENVGFIVQYFALIEDMDVYHNITLPLRHTKVSGREVKKRVIEVARKLGIEDKLKAFPEELSGGQKQRVAIARAIIKESKMILADEPTGALDSQTAEDIMKVFRSLNQEGKSVLIVTHDMGIAKQCDRIIEISDGCINEQMQ